MFNNLCCFCFVFSFVFSCFVLGLFVLFSCFSFFLCFFVFVFCFVAVCFCFWRIFCLVFAAFDYCCFFGVFLYVLCWFCFVVFYLLLFCFFLHLCFFIFMKYIFCCFCFVSVFVCFYLPLWYKTINLSTFPNAKAMKQVQFQFFIIHVFSVKMHILYCFYLYYLQGYIWEMITMPSTTSSMSGLYLLSSQLTRHINRNQEETTSKKQNYIQVFPQSSCPFWWWRRVVHGGTAGLCVRLRESAL